MKCPIDGADLLITERQGVEIDYCPQCRGVWLDRGELDKIIDRAAEVETGGRPAAAAPVPAAPPPSSYERRDYKPEYRPKDDDHRYREQYRYDDDDHRHRRKKKGFLGELFDFD